MSVLILHGVANHRPPSHWQFQLAAALAADGIEVAYPSLPDADDPTPEHWQETILVLLGELPGTPDVVCHSLGVDAFLSLGPSVVEQVGRVLLVAPPAAEPVSQVAPRFAPPIPFDAPAHWEIWCSDNDEYNPAGAGTTHGEPFGITTTVIGGAGHFTPDDGYGVWPAVIAWGRGGGASHAR